MSQSGNLVEQKFCEIQVFDLCSLHSELCEFLFRNRISQLQHAIIMAFAMDGMDYMQ